MDPDALSIGELADAVGLSRRAIRFYVQQKLLPPPLGRGRGNHYDRRHLDRLRRVVELQQAGHSLDAIRTLVASGSASAEGDESDGADGEATQAVREPGGSAASPLLAGSSVAPGANGAQKPRPAVLSAELWTRLRLGDGIELSFDATKHNPTVEQLLALRQLIRETLM